MVSPKRSWKPQCQKIELNEPICQMLAQIEFYCQTFLEENWIIAPVWKNNRPSGGQGVMCCKKLISFSSENHCVLCSFTTSERFVIKRRCAYDFSSSFKAMLSVYCIKQGKDWEAESFNVLKEWYIYSLKNWKFASYWENKVNIRYKFKIFRHDSKTKLSFPTDFIYL